MIMALICLWLASLVALSGELQKLSLQTSLKKMGWMSGLLFTVLFIYGWPVAGIRYPSIGTILKGPQPYEV